MRTRRNFYIQNAFFSVLCAGFSLMRGQIGFAASVSQKDAAAKIESRFETKISSLVIDLKIPDGTKLNFDGPWKLEIKGPLVDEGALQGLYNQQTFNREKLSFTLPFLKPPSDTAKKPGAQKYALTYFLCDTAVTWCKRIVAKGDL